VLYANFKEVVMVSELTEIASGGEKNFRVSEVWQRAVKCRRIGGPPDKKLLTCDSAKVYEHGLTDVVKEAD
jgi:hypothetical protein